MKRLLVFIVLTFTATFLYSQKSIDRLFERYAGMDGFTTVTINGNLLRLAASLDHDNHDDALPANITEIRILAQEDDGIKVENFYDAVIKDLDLSGYDEFMRIKESDQDVRMLVRTEGNKFREFLLIAGGEDNALIQIKGNMTFNEAKRFSDDAKKSHGKDMMAEHR